MYNDPSGEFIWWIPAAVAVFSHFLQSYIANQPMSFVGLLKGVVMSYIVTGISMGLEQVFTAASTALNLGKLGNEISIALANTLGGSVSSLLQGGSFEKSFFSGLSINGAIQGLKYVAPILKPIANSTESSIAAEATDVATSVAEEIRTKVLPELVIKGASKWQSSLANHITNGVSQFWSDINFYQNRQRLAYYIKNSNIAQEISAFENLLFYETPSMFLGGTPGLGIYKAGGIAAKTGIANSRALGIAGEQAVGVGSKIRIPSLTGTAKYRIPDLLTSTTLGEVKNVSHLSLTRQLTDFHMFSQQTGRQFILYTRPNTTFSGPLQNLINNGSIITKPIPFK